jgi:TonB family protein
VEFTLKRALYVLSLCLIMCTAAAGYETQVREREGEVRALAREYDAAGSEVAGIVTVRFTVGTDGAVKDAYVVSSMAMNPAFERDLLELVSGWTFSNPEKYDVVITYPFVFHKQDYERDLAAVLIGRYGAGWGAEECAAEVVRRARDNESIAVREYSRVRDEVPDAAGLMIVTLYLDSGGGLSRTSCAFSEIDDPIFKDKIRNWLGCNLPVGEYPDVILKIVIRFSPPVGRKSEPLTENKFTKVMRAYEELVYELYDGKAKRTAGDYLTVEVTVGYERDVRIVEGVIEGVAVEPTTEQKGANVPEGAIVLPELALEIVGQVDRWIFPYCDGTVTYEYRFDF